MPMLAAYSYSKKMKTRDCKYVLLSLLDLLLFLYGYSFRACMYCYMSKACTLVCQLLMIVYYITFVFIVLIIVILNWKINSRILGMVIC